MKWRRKITYEGHFFQHQNRLFLEESFQLPHIIKVKAVGEGEKGGGGTEEERERVTDTLGDRQTFR